ncbi:MAG TPA: formylmethanofuran dehydrogenase subunit C [Solirubrobacteraceae bacterium]|nr:formylmethanofuran dehydrogenase subunit C [Solirubrobacteraceae bacterium]
MTLTLTLREAPAAPVRAEALRPDRLAGLSRSEIERLDVWHGNRPAAAGDLFDVSGAGEPDVRVEGDLTRVAALGTGMAGGRLTIAGDAGPHLGAGMQDGEILVEGDAGDWAGAEMGGGRLVVRGSAGRRLGGAYVGERAGMRGGEIVVHGDAGEEAGAGLRRGLIAVAGRAGPAAGLSALAGTIVVFGALGAHPGAGMRRASIVAMTATALLPTYVRACTYQPPFLRLCLRRLRALGLPVTAEQIDGRYTRWSGDTVELRRAEILTLEPPR